VSLQPPPENASVRQPSADAPPPHTGLRRRAFLAGAGVVGAGIAGTVLSPPANAAAATSAAPAGTSPSRRRRWDPDAESDRFTVAVLPGRALRPHDFLIT